MPAFARKMIFDVCDVGTYHCVARACGGRFCAGRSGQRAEIRASAGWLRQRLELLAGVFGLDVPGFAVLASHLHVVLRNRPDVVAVGATTRSLAAGGGFARDAATPTAARPSRPMPSWASSWAMSDAASRGDEDSKSAGNSAANSADNSSIATATREPRHPRRRAPRPGLEKAAVQRTRCDRVRLRRPFRQQGRLVAAEQLVTELPPHCRRSAIIARFADQGPGRSGKENEWLWMKRREPHTAHPLLPPTRDG